MSKRSSVGQTLRRICISIPTVALLASCNGSDTQNVRSASVTDNSSALVMLMPDSDELRIEDVTPDSPTLQLSGSDLDLTAEDPENAVEIDLDGDGDDQIFATALLNEGLGLAAGTQAKGTVEPKVKGATTTKSGKKVLAKAANGSATGRVIAKGHGRTKNGVDVTVSMLQHPSQLRIKKKVGTGGGCTNQTGPNFPFSPPTATFAGHTYTVPPFLSGTTEVQVSLLGDLNINIPNLSNRNATKGERDFNGCPVSTSTQTYLRNAEISCQRAGYRLPTLAEFSIHPQDGALNPLDAVLKKFYPLAAAEAKALISGLLPLKSPAGPGGYNGLLNNYHYNYHNILDGVTTGNVVLANPGGQSPYAILDIATGKTLDFPGYYNVHKSCFNGYTGPFTCANDKDSLGPTILASVLCVL